ncbi:MAG: ATP-binding protein, partial [Mycobacteriales bacterium]
VAGLLPGDAPLVTRPPFRSPHHSATMAALVGGGSAQLIPGDASCAHGGVLFLDEAPEFAQGVLDALRQPLETGVVEIARARARARFPARFTLVLAANPCPCARSGSGSVGPGCSCTPQQRRRYTDRLSGPLLDRVDLQVELGPVSRAELLADRAGAEPTAVVRCRVEQARNAAAARLAGTGWRSTAEVPGHELRRRWPLPRRVVAPLERQFDRGLLSVRGYDRVLRVAWTLADLAGCPGPGEDHVGEALLLRIPGLAS